MQEVEGKSQYQVDCGQQCAFHPVRFTVRANELYCQHGQYDSRHFENRKGQVHWLGRKVTGEDQDGSDEQRYLLAAAQGYSQRNIEFIFDREGYRREVLDGITDNRDENDTDKNLTHA